MGPLHVVFTRKEQREENVIGVTVPGVRLDRKRLPTLSGVILAHSGSKNQSPWAPKGKEMCVST